MCWQGIYTPSKIDGGQVLAYENGLAGMSMQLQGNFNESLLSFKNASQAGARAWLACNS